MIARTQGNVQLPDWCKGVRLLCTKGGPAEGFWDAISPGGPRGKRIPLFRLEPGCSFPTGPLGETATQNLSSERDTVSQTGLLRKMHPGIPARNGMRFPSRGPMGNCVPPWRTKLGRSFRTSKRSCGGMPALATKCHPRGLGGHSQRHVTEAHISYGIPSSTDTRCPAGLPSNEARRSLRQSAQCRQSADTAK